MPLLVRITGAGFVAGIELVNGTVVRAAPIVGYMRGWSEERARQYIRRRGWRATRH